MEFGPGISRPLSPCGGWEVCRELLRMKIQSSTGSALQRSICCWIYFGWSQAHRFGKLVVGFVYWSRGDRQTKGPHNDFICGNCLVSVCKPCRAGGRPGHSVDVCCSWNLSPSVGLWPGRNLIVDAFPPISSTFIRPTGR